MAPLNKLNLNTTSKETKQKTKMTAGLLAGVVVLGLIVFFVISPNWAKITDKRATLEADKNMQARLQNKLSALTQAQQNYQQVEANIKVIDEAIPDYSNVPQVAKMLEKLASEIVEEGGPLLINDLKIDLMPNDTPTSAAEKGTLLEQNEVILLVTLTGDYQAIRDYIVKIKSLRHNFFVERIVFSASQDEIKQFLEASVTLKYNYYN